VAWPTGTTLEVTNLGAGVVTFAAGAGVTVTNTAATLAQYGSAAIIRTGLNAWIVTPRSGGASGLTLVKAQTIGTTVSSVEITSAFSATYDNYLITVAGGVASAVCNIALTFGATVTSYTYTQIQMAYNSSTVTGGNSNLAVNFPRVGHGATQGLDALVEVKSPFLSDETAVSFRAGTIGTGSATTMGIGFLDTTTSYTAFTLTPSTGTLTGGTIRVYGYQNS
jgi:hypothetical protein